MAFRDDPTPAPSDVSARVMEGKVEVQLFPRPPKEYEGFAILKVYDKGNSREAIIKGDVGMWAAKTEFRAEGVWGYDFKKGWQFEADAGHMAQIDAADVAAIEAWGEEHGVELTETMVGRSASRWGAQAQKVLNDNPWELCDLDLPFEEVDPIAAQIVTQKMDPRRCVAALSQVIINAEDEGDTFVPKAELNARLKEVMGLSPQARMGASVQTALDSLAESEDVTVSDEGVYRTETYEVELAVAKMAVERANAPDAEVDEAAALAAATTPGFELTDEQRQAALSLHTKKLALVTGGPGVGKTATLEGAIKSLEAMGTTYVLCAPTGKAAKRMSEATGREAQTLHSLLGWKYIQGLESEPNEILAQKVIVDEASMVDQDLAYKLLSALTPEQSLILVGDVDQLPAVGKGNVFHDLIDADCGKVTRLTKTFRQGAGSLLLTNAQLVRDGKEPLWTKEEAEKKIGPVLDDFEYIDTSGPKATAEAVFDYSEQHPDSLVVSPTRSGTCGVHALNDLFQKRLNPKGSKVLETEHYKIRTGDKILVTKNQKKLGIVNGDIGEMGFSDGEFVTIKVDDKLVQIEIGKAQDILELGYVLTIHKSQGSQAHQVICPMQAGGASDRMLSRNLIYTAWTRGQKACVVIGPKKVVRQALEINGTQRATALPHMLKDLDSPGHDQLKPPIKSLDQAEGVDAPDASAPGMDLTA